MLGDVLERVIYTLSDAEFMALKREINALEAAILVDDLDRYERGREILADVRLTLVNDSARRKLAKGS